MFDFSVVTTWLHSLLSGWMGDSLAILVECVLVALVIITIYAIFAIIMISVNLTSSCTASRLSSW